MEAQIDLVRIILLGTSSDPLKHQMLLDFEVIRK